MKEPTSFWDKIMEDKLVPSIHDDYCRSTIKLPEAHVFWSTGAQFPKPVLSSVHKILTQEMNTFNGRRIGVERIASGIRTHGKRGHGGWQMAGGGVGCCSLCREVVA